MIAPFTFSDTVSLGLAVVFGIFFGLSLERAGLGDPHKLTGIFYLRDFTVPKVMFTAILTAAAGLYALSDFGLLDLERVWIIPTFFWPQLVGGALFGIGYAVGGYCPGTAVAGFASGRMDALVMMAGIATGSLLFAVLFPFVERFYLSTDMGAATIPHLLGINHWLVLVVVAALAGAMFAYMEKHERMRSQS